MIVVGLSRMQSGKPIAALLLNISLMMSGSTFSCVVVAGGQGDGDGVSYCVLQVLLASWRFTSGSCVAVAAVLLLLSVSVISVGFVA